jgi:hypothetical protein
MTRAISLLLLAAAGCSKSAAAALPRAVEYLWSQQANDGGWHSRTYGMLRSGQALTPFVLEALLQVPPVVYPDQPARVDRAIAFLARNTRADGALGLADSIADYPNYSTALAVSALRLTHRRSSDALAQRMAAYLRRQQFTEQNGWRPEHPLYGAWDRGGGRRPQTRYSPLPGCSCNAARISTRNIPTARMEDSSFRPPRPILTRRPPTASMFAAMAPPRRMGYWRCWRLEVR